MEVPVRGVITNLESERRREERKVRYEFTA